MLLSLTMASCKNNNKYLTDDYLNSLVSKSGLGKGENIDDSLNELLDFGIIYDKKYSEYLNYDYLALTLNNLIQNDSISIKALKDKGIIKTSKGNKELVSEAVAKDAIEKAVNIANNRQIERKKEVIYNKVIEIEQYNYANNLLDSYTDLNINDVVYLKDIDCFKVITGITNDKYQTRDATFDEIFKSINIQDSTEIDLEKAIDITSYEDNEVYVNNNYKLLASKTKNRITKDGFNISYKINKSGIDARISKNIDGLNFFYDISLSNIKPSYAFKSDDGKNTYFKIEYKTVEELGVSIGRYKNYYLDLKNLDAFSFVNSMGSIIKEKKDSIDATITICKLKLPIEGVPTLYFNIELLARFYTSGKVEFVIANKANKGFESRNGKIRFINENKRDINLNIGGSSSASAGLNLSMEAAKMYLTDIEADLGIKAKVSTTLHLYDEDNNHHKQTSALAYSTYEDLSKDNNNVKICGDLSLYWMLKLQINTSKTLLSKFGMSKEIEFLDENNQIFNNKRHIENFILVDKCTRSDHLKTSNDKEKEVFNVDKIILKKYSKVINIGTTYNIEIKALPSGYKLSDLSYSSKDNSVASCKDGVVYAYKKGVSEIIVYTNDQKYKASINILVSEG